LAAQEASSRGNLTVVSFVLGPALTNAYLVADPEAAEAVAIDPAWEGQVIVDEASRRGWLIRQIWLTHAHFDHFGGAAAIAQACQTPVALHPEDLPLWHLGGGAAFFGIPDFDPGPQPTIGLEHGMKLPLGRYSFEVRHTPGHSPGHVVFREAGERLVFCGDLVFRSGVGRADLSGGDWETLLASIRTEILSLPDDTRLLSGHGPETTVGYERRTNPFLLG
jgi:hydroxyacylglutathione hydrolase